jgi:hypothetical protein
VNDFFPFELTFNVLKVFKFNMRFKAFIKASTRLFWLYEIFNNYNFWLKYYIHLLLNHLLQWLIKNDEWKVPSSYFNVIFI